MSLITWNPNDKGSGVVLSNNDMTARTPNQLNSVRATEGKTSGKWYWELDMNNISHIFIGVANKLASMSINLTYNPYVRGYYNGNGKKYPEEVNYGEAFQVKDTIGIALDLDDFTLEFYRNGVSQGISHTNLETLGEVFPLFTSGSSSSGGTITANFGATPFKYPVPEGYLPYDVDNAGWLIPNRYLFQCNDKILKPTMNGLELVEGTLNTQLFEEHGTEYLPNIIGQYDKEVDMVYKENLGDKKIYGYQLVGYTDLDRLGVK